MFFQSFIKFFLKHLRQAAIDYGRHVFEKKPILKTREELHKPPIRNPARNPVNNPERKAPPGRYKPPVSHPERKVSPAGHKPPASHPERKAPPVGRKNSATEAVTDKTVVLNTAQLKQALGTPQKASKRAQEEAPSTGTHEVAALAKALPQPAYVFALLLSVGAAMAPWLFPSGDRSYDFFDAMMTFVAALSALLSAMGILKKISISRQSVHAFFLSALGVASALFFVPPRLWVQHWQEVPSELPEEEHRQPLDRAEVLDLSNVRSLRLTFDPSQAGKKFRLHLVPQGEELPPQTGIGREAILIPEDGSVTLPLKAADFGLTRTQMRQLTHIAVLPEDSPPLASSEANAAKSPHADFKKIEFLTGHKNNTTPAVLRRQKPPVSQEIPPVAHASSEVLPDIWTPPQERPPVHNNMPRQNIAAWQLIADSSQTWTDGKMYSVYAEGRFNLSKADFIRVTFDPSQAGIKFWLRLIPEGANSGQPIGVRWRATLIPNNGVVILPLDAEEFGLTDEDMRQLSHISILSGNKAWNRSLGQAAGKHAHFKKIEIFFSEADFEKTETP